MTVANIIALSILAWVFIVGRGPFAAPVSAGTGLAFPDAAGQRLQIIQELRDLNRNVAALHKLIEKEEVKVKVTSLPARQDDDKRSQ
ncbi:MAG: hypothetical protein ACOC0P_05200 [Planctomycetota bacterium]